MNIIRRLMCRFGLCGGFVDHEQDAQGIWWVGLRCATCKKLNCPVKSRYQDAALAKLRALTTAAHKGDGKPQA